MLPCHYMKRAAQKTIWIVLSALVAVSMVLVTLLPVFSF